MFRISVVGQDVNSLIDCQLPSSVLHVFPDSSFRQRGYPAKAAPLDTPTGMLMNCNARLVTNPCDLPAFFPPSTDPFHGP